jgi:hemolysin activation/secretion protein
MTAGGALPVRAWHRAGAAAAFGLMLFAISSLACAADPKPAAPAPAAAAAGPVFDLLELRVLGNTVLDARSIESAVYPYTGPGKQMADVEAARAALERAYHDRGYGTVFVDIPEQSVDDGVVRLRVTEGRLRQVRVSGARYFSGRQILAGVPAAAPGAVPNLPQLQSELNQLNRQTADRVVVPVLKAGPDPGTVDLNLRVNDHSPFHGSVGLNNQYTIYTEHLRAAGSLSYDNMFGRLDTLTLQYQVAPQSPSQSHVLAGSYALRLGPDGSSLSLTYIDSKSDVATVGTLGVLGTGYIYGLRYLKPLPVSGSAQDFALEIDYKDFKQSVLLTGPNPGLQTPVDYITGSASYTYARRAGSSQSDWTATATFGLRGVPDNQDQFANKRFGAQANFFYLRGDGGYTWQLPKSFSATLRLTGQYSPDPLISNEQLAVGGAYSVRGYLEAEELADSAIRGSVQLGAPPLKLSGGRLQLREFVFYDAANAWTVDPLPGEPRRVGLRSWGAGLTLDGFEHLMGTFTWADPLADGAQTRSGNSWWLFDVRGFW